MSYAAAVRLRRPWVSAWLVVALPLGVALLASMVAACGESDGDAVSDDSLIYAAVIQCLVEEARPQEHPLESTAFVATPEVDVRLEDQVAVVQQLEELAPVRFIDEREEAVVEDRPKRPVRDEGILITLGPIDGRDGRAEVDVERYERSDSEMAYRLVLTEEAETWRVSEPTPPASPRAADCRG